MSSRNKGICFIILSAFSFALMGACVRLAGDVPSIQKSFFRNLVAFFVALIMIVRSGDGFEIKKGNLGYMVLRATFGTLGILCNFYAVDHLVLSDASMLNKMSPFFVILFSFLLLKEKLKPAQAIAIFVAFIGSLFIIKPTFTNMELFPSVIGLCGGIGAGIAYAMVRILGQRGQKGSSVVLFFSGFSCIVTLPYLLLNYHPMTGTQILALLGAGLAAAGGQFGITAAYYHAPAKEISIYDYSQIIFSTILGYFLFGQVPDKYSVLGRLEKNIIDVIKEEQAKLGYRKEKIRLYYPLSSLNHFFQLDVDETGMQEKLSRFSEYEEGKLGSVEVTNKGERFCFHIPEEGAEYVHNNMKENEFIKDLIGLISHHGCKMEDIFELFRQHSDQITIEEMHSDEFDYMICFENDPEDTYRYCFKDEGYHIIYHRFLPEDYEEFGFGK